MATNGSTLSPPTAPSRTTAPPRPMAGHAPTPGTPPEELLNALLQVFSAKGFEGASLAELASASSRSKASLYHHFPGGKQQMIEVLVERCRQALDVLAFDPLRQITAATEAAADKTTKKHAKNKDKNKGRPKNLKREQEAAHKALERFVDGFDDYLRRHDGHCLLATLALTQPELLGSAQRDQLADWLALLAHSCEQAGHKPKAARRLAQASLARLYGSLTLAAMGSHITVSQACKWLKRDLLG